MAVSLWNRLINRAPESPAGPGGDSTCGANGIELRNIVKTFKTPAGDFTALKGINLLFREGEFVGVTGKSGSGKSTLINMITGIDRPTSGEIRIGETFVHTMNESQMAMWRGRNLGIVFQFYQLLPMLSLLENVMLPMDFCNMYDPAERETRAAALLKRVGLEQDAHKMPAAVAGGQQQAAAIARAIANDPCYLIADEPTGNLDSRTAENIFEMFEELSSQGKTILMITHDPALANRTQRQVVMSDGEIIDEWIYNTFPMLTHPQMLRLTKSMQPRLLVPETVFSAEDWVILPAGTTLPDRLQERPAAFCPVPTHPVNFPNSKAVLPVSGADAQTVISLPKEIITEIAAKNKNFQHWLDATQTRKE